MADYSKYFTFLDVQDFWTGFDSKGGKWLFLSINRSTVDDYIAISPFYPRDQKPLEQALSKSGLRSDVNSYAESHSRFTSPEIPYTDKNGVHWVWVYDVGVIDDDYYAATEGYGGRFVEADKESDLVAGIEYCATKYADLAKKPFSTSPLLAGTKWDPKTPKPPSPTDPKVDPSKVEPLPATEDETIKKGWAVATKKAASPVIAQAHVSLGWMESHLGTKGQFLLAGNVPSWNWGAVMAREGQQFFLGTGNTSDFKFARFNTMAEGYDNFAGLSTVVEANKYFASGDVLGAVSVMYDRHYFVVNGDGRTAPERERHIRDYAAAVLGSANRVASVTGQKMLLHGNGAILPAPAGTPSEEGSGGLLVAGGLVAAGIWWFTRK